MQITTGTDKSGTIIDEGDPILGIGIVENNNDKPIFITKIESWATLNVTKSS